MDIHSVSLRRRSFCTALLALSLAVASTVAQAQCPDGTPPPCKRGAAGAARRAPVALNSRAWIVAPFSNATKSADLDWLREASVNLLTLDLGRWTDIAVVDDKRVGDLLRELPAGTRSAQALTLNDGLALARNAGAGNLVMGDFYKVGSGVRLVVNVYDVKSGNRLRSVTQQVVSQDSLLPAFGPLALSALAVPPPPDAKVGTLGTTRTDAYQEYLIGVRALHRFKTEESIVSFKKALSLDSTFALAHYQLALSFAWSEMGTTNEGLAHALDAKRLGGALPPRERTMINALVPFLRRDYTSACAAIAPLAQKDSVDVQVLYQYGECLFHDQTVAAGAADSLPGTFRGNWNTALRTMQTVLEIDPSMQLAYDHLVYILTQTQRRGVMPGRPGYWFAAMLRSGDTLEMRAWPRDSAHVQQLRDADRRALAERPAQINLAKAEVLARQWVDLDTTSTQARAAVASVLVRRGNVDAAYAQLRRVPLTAIPSNVPALDAAWSLAAKTGRGAEARAWLDSLFKVKAADPGSVPPYYVEADFTFGRMRRYIEWTVLSRPDTTPALRAIRDYAREAPWVEWGLPRPSLDSVESAYGKLLRPTARCDSSCTAGRLWRTHGYAMRAPRTPTTFYARGAQYSLAFSHDTALMRRVAQQSEAAARQRVQVGWTESFTDETPFIADYYLILGDSAAALRVARLAVDSTLMRMELGFQGELSTAGTGELTSARPAALLPRMMMLRADLAAKLGYPDEARVWYSRMLDLWADADPELQPTVQRMRAALAALPPARK